MSDDAGTIVLSGLTKRFGRVTAVEGLSFTAAPGVVTGFGRPVRDDRSRARGAARQRGAHHRRAAAVPVRRRTAARPYRRAAGLDPYLPGVAADGLTEATQAGVRLLAPWLGGLVFAAWALAFAAGGTLRTIRRDVT